MFLESFRRGKSSTRILIACKMIVPVSFSLSTQVALYGHTEEMMTRVLERSRGVLIDILKALSEQRLRNWASTKLKIARGPGKGGGGEGLHYWTW